MQKENCRAAHTAVFCLCEMVSTNFKHINANIVSSDNWVHLYHTGVGSSCGRQVHLCENETGFICLSWKHSAFSGFVLNCQFVVYHKRSGHPCLSRMTDSSTGNLIVRWTIVLSYRLLSQERTACAARLLIWILNLMQLRASYGWLA